MDLGPLDLRDLAMDLEKSWRLGHRNSVGVWGWEGTMITMAWGINVQDLRKATMDLIKTW